MVTLRLHVTDHALVRYMERVMHLDMDKVREDIRAMAENSIPMSGPPRGARMNPSKKAMFIVEEDRIVTVIGAREIQRGKGWMFREAAE